MQVKMGDPYDALAGKGKLLARLQKEYTGTPASTSSSPGQVLGRVFGEMSRSIAISEANTI